MAKYVHRLDLSSGWIEVGIDYEYDQLSKSDRALLSSLRQRFVEFEESRSEARVDIGHRVDQDDMILICGIPYSVSVLEQVTETGTVPAVMLHAMGGGSGGPCKCGHAYDDHTSGVAVGCDAMAVDSEEVCPCTEYRPAGEDPVLAAQAAHYFSTYCLHGLHADCRWTCETCGKSCRCSCHTDGEDA